MMLVVVFISSAYSQGGVTTTSTGKGTVRYNIKIDMTPPYKSRIRSSKASQKKINTPRVSKKSFPKNERNVMMD